MPAFTVDQLATRGAFAKAPPGLLARSESGPFWRYLRKLYPRDRGLGRAPGVEALENPPTFDVEFNDRKVIDFVELSPETLNPRYLLVTNREVLLGIGGTWEDVTPIYNAGTVSITSGTATLTGSGTAWQTRLIDDNQSIELPDGSGDWYKIQSVGSDTSITLSTNYTGTTLSGDNYRIRRNFDDADRVFVVELNGDVYIAGKVSFASFSGLVIGDGGVLVVSLAASAFDFSSVGVAGFVTSGQDAPDAGIDNLGYLINPQGLGLLPDGRLVMPVHWQDNASPDAANNRVLFSSHLDPLVWTSSPGGFADVVEGDSITALAQDARIFALHFTNGIQVVEQTGQDDEPLAFYSTRATVGAIGPKATAVVPAGHLFIGSDLNLHQFSGSDTKRLDVGVREDLRDGTWKISGLLDLKMRWDEYRQELGILISEDPGSTFDASTELRINLENGSYSTRDYPTNVTHLTTLRRSDGNVAGNLFEVDPRGAVDIVGTEAKDFSGGDTDSIYRSSELVATDTIPSTISGPEDRGPLAESDELSFGTLYGLKVIREIRFHYVSTINATDTLDLDIVRDGLTESITGISFPSGVLREQVVAVQPDESRSARIFVLRLKSSDGNTWVPILTRITIDYVDVAEERAV